MIRTKPVYGMKEFHLRYVDYNKVYHTPEGKKVIDDILYFAAIDRTAYCMKSDTQTNFNLGKQAMGYHVVAAITEPFLQLQPKETEEHYND